MTKQSQKASLKAVHASNEARKKRIEDAKYDKEVAQKEEANRIAKQANYISVIAVLISLTALALAIIAINH